MRTRTPNTSTHGERRRRLAAVLLPLLWAASCADQGDQEVGVVEEAVEGGLDLSGTDDFSGMVRLWTTNTQFNEFRQFCSGVMLRNNIILTAAHCLQMSDEAQNHGWPDFRNDVSGILVTTNRSNYAAWGTGFPVWSPDGRDVAAFRLTYGLPVRAGGQVRNSGFNREIASAPEPGTRLALIGYGPPGDPASTICNYTSLESGQRIRGCYADPLSLNWNVGGSALSFEDVIVTDVAATGGDSGGATAILNLFANSLADMPLLGINSIAWRCIDPSMSCGAISARLDDIRDWVDSLHFP